MKESGRTYFSDKIGRVSFVGSGPLKDCSDVFWQAVGDLNKIIGPAVPKARALIEASSEVGKVDMKTVEIVHCLRITWEHRKGKPAPKNVAEGSAFYKFVDAVFTVLEVKREVRSAVDAWRKFDRSFLPPQPLSPEMFGDAKRFPRDQRAGPTDWQRKSSRFRRSSPSKAWLDSFRCAGRCTKPLGIRERPSQEFRMPFPGTAPVFLCAWATRKAR